MWIRGIAAALVALLSISTQALAYDPAQAARYPSMDLNKPNANDLTLFGTTAPGDVAGSLVKRFSALPLPASDYGIKCDGVTDDAPAIRAALAAAQKRLNKTLLLPAGTCLIGSTVTAPNLSNVKTVGAGTGAGPASQTESLADATVLKWTGPIGGLMFDWQRTDTSLCPALNNQNCAYTSSSRIEDLVFDGNGKAATAIRIRGLYRSDTRIKIRNVTATAVDMDTNTTVPSGPNAGGGDVAKCNFDMHIDLTSPAAVNAKGIVIGDGTSYQDVHENYFRVYIVHQAGTGMEMRNSDGNIIFGQVDRSGQGTAGVAFGLGVTGSGIPAGSQVTAWDASTITLSANATATGRIEAQLSTGSYLEANTTSGSSILTNVRTGWSIDLKASPINGFGPGGVTQSARSNIFTELQAAAGIVSRQGYAATQSQLVLAAYNNRILNWTQESFERNARIEGIGTPYGSNLVYTGEAGIHYNENRFETTNGGAFLVGGPEAPRTGIAFPSSKSYSSLAEFGTDRPVYMLGPNPGIGFNLYDTFSGLAYGPGSNNNYASIQRFDTNSGRFSVYNAPAGNAGAIASGVSESFATTLSGNKLGPSLSADPASCSFGGQVYWNTTSRKYRVCNTTDGWSNLGQ